MGDFNRIEDFIIRVPDMDVRVLPVYPDFDVDPNVNEVKSIVGGKDYQRIASPHAIGEFEIVQTDDEYLVAVYLEPTSKTPILVSVLNDIFEYLDEHFPSAKAVAIGLLGIVEHGYHDEGSWENKQSQMMMAYAKKHKDLDLSIVVPLITARPLTGKGDDIQIEDDQDTPTLDSHPSLDIEIPKVASYVDYLRQYIAKRADGGYIIRINDSESFDGKGIQSVRDLQRNLAYYEGRKKNENFSKWNVAVKSKQTGEKYAPVPSKQKLKLIILMLDMNYLEAKPCLDFFGYGLAYFDPEDRAFAAILRFGRKDKTAYDIPKINKALVRKFGKKAALYTNHGKAKKGKKA